MRLAGFGRRRAHSIRVPRTLAERCAIDVAKRSESLDGRINPATERNITGSHVSSLAKGREFVVLFALVELAIARNFRIAVVGMGTEHLVAPCTSLERCQ